MCNDWSVVTAVDGQDRPDGRDGLNAEDKGLSRIPEYTDPKHISFAHICLSVAL